MVNERFSAVVREEGAGESRREQGREWLRLRAIFSPFSFSLLE